MMINGILAKMIFDANKARNAFYVEESYVIPWMYPYLEPHGLIMKINKQPLPELTPQMVKNDHEFWDWYCKRLLGNWKFTHDVVARKTFSKLRGAIAGLYAYRHMFDEAEYAFKQAIQLYPLSPEANFRLADVYMQQRRFTNAQKLIRVFLAEDPDNDKVADFLRQITGTAKADARRQELERSLGSGRGAELKSAMELAEIYRRMGMDAEFQQLTIGLLNDARLPPSVCLGVAKLYAESKRIDLLGMALQRYVQRNPTNSRVWVDLAAVQALTRRTNDSLLSLRRAVETGGDPVRSLIRNDPRFDSLRDNGTFKRLVPPAKSLKLPSDLSKWPGI